jgi:hypothetical protein
MIEGYVSAMSVPQGGTVTFHLSGDSGEFGIEVYRKGINENILVSNAHAGKVLQETTPPNAYRIGCGWPISYQLYIPDNWSSGIYNAKFIQGNDYTNVLFVVNTTVPGSTSKILFQLATNTYHAYNAWGGKSLYDFNSTDETRSSIVSFDRPLTPFAQFFEKYEYNFVRWLETVGVAVECCTSVDLHSNAALLDNYQLLVSVGHDARSRRKICSKWRKRCFLRWQYMLVAGPAAACA